MLSNEYSGLVEGKLPVEMQSLSQTILKTNAAGEKKFEEQQKEDETNTTQTPFP